MTPSRPAFSRHTNLPAFVYDVTATQVALVSLAALTVFYCYWPCVRAFFPMEINRNEPWNAWFTDAAMNGGPLYPGADQLIVNNYPPLSFYSVGVLSKLTGDTIFAGRLVSIMAAGATAFAVAWCVASLGALSAAGAFGGLWFMATLGSFMPQYIGMNDPNLLALAAMGLSLAFFLARLRAGKAVEPAIACMAVAGFIKHTLVAIPVTAIVWLYLNDKPQAIRAAVFGSIVVVLGLAVCVALYGNNFLDQLFISRAMSFSRALGLLGKFQWLLPVLLFWSVWALQNKRKPAARFSALLLAISSVTSVAQRAGMGVSANALFELLFTSSIAAGLAFEWIGSTAPALRTGPVLLRNLMIAAVIVRLLLTDHAEPYLALASPAFRHRIQQEASTAEAEIARVRTIPDPVDCSIMTVCYRAGKKFVYDGFWVRQFIVTGKRTAEEAQEAVTKAGIRFARIETGH